MIDRPFIKAVFDRYKRKSPEDPLVCLPVFGEERRLIAWLKPVTRDYRDSAPYLPELLGRWRVENPVISTGTFKVTTERTLRWLDDLIIGRDDRMLFMLEGIDGSPLGHLGYSNFSLDRDCGEVDNVLRGVKSVRPGLMRHAMVALLRWGLTELRLREIELSVYSDNERAVRFYERLGFTRTHVKPLRKVILPDEQKWELASADDRGPFEKHYLYMRFDLGRAPHDVAEALNRPAAVR